MRCRFCFALYSSVVYGEVSAEKILRLAEKQKRALCRNACCAVKAATKKQNL